MAAWPVRKACASRGAWRKRLAAASTSIAMNSASLAASKPPYALAGKSGSAAPTTKP
ncbi:hypothetical protein D3C81_1504980 [compost metagenome]